MAFDTLGVNVTASGIKGVANDIGRLAASFVKYVGAVKKAEEASNKAAIAQSLLAKKMADKAAERQAKLVERAARAQEKLAAAALKAAQSQVKLATSMAGSAQTNLDKLIRKQGTLSSQVTSLTAKVASLTLTMRNHAAVKVNYDSAVAQVQKYEQAIKNVEATARTTKAGKIYLDDARKIAPIVDALRTKLSAANVELAKQSKIYAQSITQQAAYRNAIAALSKATQELVNIEKGIPVAREKLVRATADAAEAEKYLAEMMANSGEAATEASEGHQELEEAQEAVISQSTELENGLDAVIGMLNDSSGAASGLTSIISQLVPGLSSLSGGFGATGGASTALAGALGISTGALAGIVVGIGAAVLAFKAIKVAIDVAVKVVQVAWQVFKKLVAVVWDVAKAIGKTLWNALTKIVSAPFKLISSLFGGIAGSMKRVLEMAIGMNLSRIWWQLGMKIRDMAKTASDAAIEYQVTFTRLSTLMKNEFIGQLGPTPSTEEYNTALKQASEATEELIGWTSKLAVLTIFSAEDILNVYTLAMSYGFASTQAEKLTESVLDFASGMGLGDTEMKRIIENFGQMRAQGKITGTELRDLARGSFVPVNDVLEQMAENVGLIGDYDIPNMQAISDVLKNMADNGEITNETFETMSGLLGKLGADGKITRQEFDGLVQELSQSDIMQKFGLTAEQAGKALEGIKTGKLTEDLNELIRTGKITIDEFFEAFIEMVEDKYPNAAKSMGLTMKAVKSNIEDYIATMIGWRLIAPVFEVVAKHVQNFIQNTLMDESQIIMFDKMGKAFKVVAELVMTYGEAMRKANDIFGKLTQGPFSRIKLVFQELFDVIGKLGTPEFSQRMILNFTSLLRGFGMAVDKSNIVFSGIAKLNEIMSDIMNGVEINPEVLGKALNDTFGTLWTDFFGPTIKNGLELAWSKHVAPAIGRLWQKMKDKFSEWKTDTLLPGIKTFFGETLPGWIKGFGTWITENGPKIIKDIGQFVSDILTQFIKITTFHFGEDNPLTRLLVTIKELATYATFKIADPTSEVNSKNASNLADALNNLWLSIKNVVTQTGPFQTFLDFLNSDKFQEPAEHIFNLVNIIGTLFGVLISPISLPKNAGFSGVINWLLGSIEELAAKMLQDAALLMAAVSGIMIPINALISLFEAFPQVDFERSAPWEWIGQFYRAFDEGVMSSAGVEAWKTSIEALDYANGVLSGIDPYNATKNVDQLVSAIGSWSELSPLAPINLDQPFNVTGSIDTSGMPVGIAYNETTGTFDYIGGAAGQDVTIPPVTYTQSFTVNGEVQFNNLPAGYTYNEETGLIEFKPIISQGLKTLPITTLQIPIEINGKTYYNLPPGFSINTTTGQLEWSGIQKYDIHGEPITVEQQLQMILKLLEQPGFAIDPTTGAIIYTPPKKKENTVVLDVMNGTQPVVITPEMIIVGDVPGWSIGPDGIPVWNPVRRRKSGGQPTAMADPIDITQIARVTPEMVLSGDAPPGFELDAAGNVIYTPPTAQVVQSPPISVEQPVTVTVTPTTSLPDGSPLLEGPFETAGANWLYNLINPTGLTTTTAPAIDIVNPVNVTPVPTLPDGTDASKKDWIDTWLNKNIIGEEAAVKSLSVDVEITPTTDATTSGSTMATEFSSGFSTTITTEMAAVEIPIPEITAERRRKASTSASEMVAEIAAVFSSDMSVASAGSTMMSGLIEAVLSSITNVESAAESIIASIANALSSNTSVASAGSTMMGNLITIIADTATNALQATANIISAIAAVFSSDTTVASAGSTMMSNFMTAINSSSADAQEAATNIASSLSGPLNGLAGAFTSAGANAVQGLWNGMASVMGSLIAWWIGQVAYLNSIVPNLTYQRSPSKLYYKYGENMMKGLQLGLESGQEGAVSQMHDAAIELRQALGAINTGTISPQQYSNVSNTTNWNVNVTTPLVASTPIQAYEILRMRAR